MKIKIYTFFCTLIWVGFLAIFLEYFALPFVRDNEPYVFFPSELMYQYIGLTRTDIMLCTSPSIVFIAFTLALSKREFEKKLQSISSLIRFNIIEFLLFNTVISLFLFGSKSYYFICHFAVISCLILILSVIYFFWVNVINKG
ncbi:hypothetical protein ACG9ZJ_20970 [Acinetobacter sp. ULE_I064]|uniref:hypothetical protein n=1 Tax=Acinetobacter sp. ULE_I064 TaxID=3373071 RepID=UPI003AF91963